MKTKQTQLIGYFINPSFLEQITQPLSSIEFMLYWTFNFIRNGRKYSITIYSGEEGQVNISNVNEHGTLGNVIISDYCQTIEDLKSMFEKLDDLAKRMPKQ